MHMYVIAGARHMGAYNNVDAGSDIITNYIKSPFLDISQTSTFTGTGPLLYVYRDILRLSFLSVAHTSTVLRDYLSVSCLLATPAFKGHTSGGLACQLPLPENLQLGSRENSNNSWLPLLLLGQFSVVFSYLFSWNHTH